MGMQEQSGLKDCVSVVMQNSVDDVEHMIFDCVAMDVERQKHKSMSACGRASLVDFLPGPNRIVCFCARLLVARLAKSDK